MTQSSPFAQSQKPSRRERRDAAERARTRRSALEAAALADAVAGHHHHLHVPRFGHESPGETADGVHPPRWLARMAAAAVVLVAAVFLAVFEGYPVDGAGWHWPWAAGGTAAAVALAWYVWQCARRAARRRGVRVVMAGLAMSAMLLGAGLSTTTVVGGKAYLNSSATAKAYRLSLRIRSDLYRMAADDQLLGADQTTARADYSKYGPAAAQLNQISSYYAGLEHDPAALPSDQFLQLVTVVADAAYWGAQAVTAKAQDIVTPDPDTEANITSWRQTFVTDVLTAGPQLGHLASLYGINLTGNQKAPVE